MPRKWLTLVSVCLSMFMLVAFVMMVPLALPDVQHRLDASFGELQWVINAYTLALAALLLTAGALADRFGRRLVYIAGLSVAAIASLLCAAAPNIAVLIGASALLGIGGAMMFATSLALLGNAYPGPDRAFAFGASGTAIAAALALGPLAGGALVALFGWRAVFAACAPITVLALAIARRGIAESRDAAAAGRPLDWAGAALFSAAAFSLIFALIRGNAVGLARPLILAAFVAAALLLASFLAVEAGIAAKANGRAPMLDLALFKRPAFTGAAIAAATGAFANFGLTFYVTIYFIDVLGDTAFVAGLKLLTITAVSVIASTLSGRWLGTIAARLLIGAALGLVAAGDGLLYAVMADTMGSWTALLPGFILIGIGAGALNPPLGATAIGAAPPDQAGIASGVNNTFRQLGTALGIALLGALFAAHIAGALAPLGQSVPAEAVGLIASGRFGQAASLAPPAARDAIAAAAPHAFATGLRELFAIMAAVAAVGAAAALALIRPMSDAAGSRAPSESR